MAACIGAASLAAASDDVMVLPSGQSVRALEYITGDDGVGPVVRARYLAEWLEAGGDSDALFEDMTHLCQTDALKARDALSPETTRVIVSLSAAAVEFGEIAPDVPQYFEVYTVQDGLCIWELY